MKLESPRRLLGRPAFHVVVGLLFAGAFVWPMFAIHGPRSTWWFLHVAWVLSVAALYLVSRGRDDDADGEKEGG